MKPTELSAPAQLMKFIVGRWISKPIYVAAELGIADILAEGPKDIEEMAQVSRSHAPSLYRMMRALASVGIFSETDGRRFELTPMAGYLKTDAMRSIAILFNSDWSDKSWGYFMDSIKTGETAFEKAHGKPLMDWLGENPQAAQVFSEANAVKAANSHRAIVDVYDFSGIHRLTDVGGGLGTLMAEILTANPLLKGVVADTFFVIQETQKMIQTRGIEDRCQALECDFFKEIPAGSDAYLMSHVLHDWSDEQCRIILANCHRAMKTESRLLIVEMIVPPGNEPSIAKLLDLEMLVTTGGRERTEKEFQTLLESSGFTFSRTIATKENIFIIEGLRA
ncbi:methyltransferase [Desulfospira joergensenii]|uniref:methyltransferase n=1 Tax=Desulfospira joergensenii TaxID=53329 RepID=UPI0003B67516|nr:methyltransferase [Desulfospira joergensenii]